MVLSLSWVFEFPKLATHIAEHSDEVTDSSVGLSREQLSADRTLVKGPASKLRTANDFAAVRKGVPSIGTVESTAQSCRSIGSLLGVQQCDRVGAFGGSTRPSARNAARRFLSRGVWRFRSGLGADTGIVLKALVDCGAWISAALNREVRSRISQALLAKRPSTKSSANES